MSNNTLGKGGKSASDPRIRPFCSICGNPYKDWGHNAWPINDGRCCTGCNDDVVIPARIVRAQRDGKAGPVDSREAVEE